MNSLAKLAATVALSLSFVLAGTSAFAGDKDGKGDKGGRGDKRDKVAFPVEGAAFKQRVDARLAKQQTKLEERIANKSLPADKAEAMRKRFAERRAKVNATVEKAVADGTVTKEEAKEVKQAAGHHGHRGHHGKGKKGKPALGTAALAAQQDRLTPRGGLPSKSRDAVWISGSMPRRSFLWAVIA